MNSFGQSATSPAPSNPQACPACRSALVTTKAKHPDAESYWRCEQCGEIWNSGRRQDRPRRTMPWQ